MIDQLLVYHCGMRTNDLADGYNHAGTDMFLWPIPWMQQKDSVPERGIGGGF